MCIQKETPMRLKTAAVIHTEKGKIHVASPSGAAIQQALTNEDNFGRWLSYTTTDGDSALVDLGIVTGVVDKSLGRVEAGTLLTEQISVRGLTEQDVNPTDGFGVELQQYVGHALVIEVEPDGPDTRAAMLVFLPNEDGRMLWRNPADESDQQTLWLFRQAATALALAETQALAALHDAYGRGHTEQTRGTEPDPEPTGVVAQPGESDEDTHSEVRRQTFADIRPE